jgi:two-component system, cell cycle response regulator DivK
VPLILVVEDFLDARELYADYLTYSGFQVVTAINGHDAKRQAGFFRPDLILMDIRMPGMDGLEATADLKASPALAGIPIVAITADPSPELAARAVEAGCVTCLAKPVLPDVLVACISGLVKVES